MAALSLLLVDDDLEYSRLLGQVLEHGGLGVSLCGNGASALEEVSKRRFDLILLDVTMPGLDGPATLGALESMNPQVRSVFMSGHFGKYSEADLLRRGAKQVFNKPFDLAELAARLRQLLDG